MRTYNYNYVYKITNLSPVDERKYYIGVRSCDCPPDTDIYMSSSKILKEHIKTYGTSNFKKEILKCFTTRTDAMNYEIELHELYHVDINPEYYNKAKQLSDGFSCPYSHTPEQIEKMKHTLKEYWDSHPEKREQYSQRYSGSGNPFYGKTHTSESKQKVGAASKGRIPSDETRKKLSASRTGEKNHWYGKKFSPEYCQKIADHHADVSGSNNPAAKTFLFTSPTGEEYIVTGGISKFCKEHGLSYSLTLRKYIGKGIIPNGQNQGWSLQNISSSSSSLSSSSSSSSYVFTDSSPSSSSS